MVISTVVDKLASTQVLLLAQVPKQARARVARVDGPMPSQRLSRSYQVPTARCLWHGHDDGSTNFRLRYGEM
jgi:hypothetical protein